MFVLRAQSFAGATCASASPAVSLGNHLPSLGFSFGMNVCLFPALCWEALNNFPPKILTVHPDGVVHCLHVSSNGFIIHSAPSGVLAEMPGKWEHATLCQSEILKSVLRLSVLPASASLWVGCTSQQDKPKNSQNSWNTKEKKARDQGIVQKHPDVKCKTFFAEKAQGFLWRTITVTDVWAHREVVSPKLFLSPGSSSEKCSVGNSSCLLSSCNFCNNSGPALFFC